MNRTTTLIIAGIAGLIAIIVLFQSIYIVNEEEQVVVTQFGKPVGDPITTPGLKFKTPFVQNANYFDKRYLEWDGDPNQVPTKSKKYIFVDTYARWQITDPLQFFKRLTNEKGAQSRLDDILDGETRDNIASHELEEAVRSSSDRDPVKAGGKISQYIKDTLPDVKVGRDEIQNKIQDAARKQAQDLGIKILDFRIKRINYVENVRKQVYQRMRSERTRIADKFRSQGQGEASSINGDKEKDLKEIQSEAFRKSEKIKGKADAEAADIYARAYSKSPRAKELYSFLKSMETYGSTFDENTSVILSTDSELYKYLNDIR